jgi:rubrerythrin
MTAVAPATPAITEAQLNACLQYTVEAYKTFEKLAENLKNPLSAQMFTRFAVEERAWRDLIEMKLLSLGGARVRVTLGADLLFEDMFRGELSDRESTEFLIAREKTMQRKLGELTTSSGPTDRSLLIYLASGKKAHVVELERELELIRLDARWYSREDAETRLVHGTSSSE